jgi:hypothetical protein
VRDTFSFRALFWRGKNENARCPEPLDLAPHVSYRAQAENNASRLSGVQEFS